MLGYTLDLKLQNKIMIWNKKNIAFLGGNVYFRRNLDHEKHLPVFI